MAWTVLDEALACQARGQFPIPLAPRDKVPEPRFSWKKWISQPRSDAEIREAFRGEQNIAVALGDPSGDLTDRDFDDANAYREWATNHRSLARSCPTVRTGRDGGGYRVLMRTRADDVASYTKCGTGTIAKFRDGELRRGGYGLLPPSIHPSGRPYLWTLPHGQLPFVDDVKAAGLVPKNIQPHKPEVYISHLGVAGGTLGGESEGVLEQLAEGILAAGLESEPWASSSVIEAIRLTAPRKVGQRDNALIDLARRLKAMPELCDDPESLNRILARWHGYAFPHIGTKDFGTTARGFWRAYGRVKTPYGQTLRAAAAQAVGDGVDRLEDICRILQEWRGEEPFNLDCRNAAEALKASGVEVSHVTANKWLNKLIEAGRLVLVQEMSRAEHRARRFRYRSEQWSANTAS